MAGLGPEVAASASELFDLLDENKNGILEIDEWRKRSHYLANVSSDFFSDPEEAFQDMGRSGWFPTPVMECPSPASRVRARALGGFVCIPRPSQPITPRQDHSPSPRWKDE